LLPQLLRSKSRRFAPHLPRRLSVQSRISLVFPRKSGRGERRGIVG
jgi:hypothetical protein